jgi:hypothetical protein
MGGEHQPAPRGGTWCPVRGPGRLRAFGKGASYER